MNTSELKPGDRIIHQQGFIVTVHRVVDERRIEFRSPFGFSSTLPVDNYRTLPDSRAKLEKKNAE